MNMLAIRFKPEQDLKVALERVIKENNIQSGYIATCVGSLHTVTIRMAGAKPDHQDIRKYEGHYEIISLVGTLAQDGVHIHISFSDSEGHVYGGHLKERSLVTTTAEVVIGYDQDVRFGRELDESTGFDELSVS